MSQDQPFIWESSLGRPKVGGVEPQGISKVGQTVLARMMEPQMWHQPMGLVWGGLGNGTMASVHPDARHFVSLRIPVVPFNWYTKYGIDTSVLELRERESQEVNLCVGSSRGTA